MDAVQLLLYWAPKIQTLYFELTHRCGFNCFERDSHLKKSLGVPECLSSHLTTHRYREFAKHDMELVEHILNKAKVLETMKITVKSNLDSKNKLCSHKEVMKFPRAS